jgi:hypothetical protein
MQEEAGGKKHGSIQKRSINATTRDDGERGRDLNETPVF